MRVGSLVRYRLVSTPREALFRSGALGVVLASAATPALILLRAGPQMEGLDVSRAIGLAWLVGLGYLFAVAAAAMLTAVLIAGWTRDAEVNHPLETLPITTGASITANVISGYLIFCALHFLTVPLLTIGASLASMHPATVWLLVGFSSALGLVTVVLTSILTKGRSSRVAVAVSGRALVAFMALLTTAFWIWRASLSESERELIGMIEPTRSTIALLFHPGALDLVFEGGGIIVSVSVVAIVVAAIDLYRRTRARE